MALVDKKIKDFDVTVFNFFLLGFLSSGTSYILNMIFGDNGVKYEYRYMDRNLDQ